MKPPHSIARNEHLIDRHLVVFAEATGSHCVCNEFSMAGECRHTRESDGRRAAQTLIANRVRSIHGNKQHDDAVATKRHRSRSLALIRVR